MSKPLAPPTQDLATYLFSPKALKAALVGAHTEQMAQTRKGAVRVSGNLDYVKILSAMLESITEAEVKARIEAGDWFGTMRTR